MIKNATKHIIPALLLLAIVLTACGGNDEDGRTSFEQGLEEMQEGNLPVAYRLFHNAIVAFGEKGDSIGMFEAKTHLSLLCSTIGQKKEGSRLVNSTPYFHIRRDGNYSSQYYWRMKAYYAFTLDGNYKAAADYINTLLELDKADYPDRPTYLYMDMANLAEMYFMTGQARKAWDIIRLLEANPLADDMYLSQTYYVHALLLDRQGKADSACAYAARSMKYSAMYDAPENEANAMRIIMKRDSARGDMASYIKQRNAYDSLTNRIRGSELSHHIAVIQERHKYDLAFKEAQRQHMERNLWSGGLALCAAAMCVITFLLYKQNKLKLESETAERRRLDREIEYKRLENELLTLKMEQTKEELAKQRNDNADALKQLVAADERKGPRTRLEILEATLNTNHAPFIRHIEKQHPQLTHNDMLILGFMRMDMTSQEAASALGISIDSYQKARYRLRKKLQINTTDALVDFVKNWDEAIQD